MVGVAFVVWFLPLVTKIKIGGSEIELGQRIHRLEDAKDTSQQQIRDLELREASLMGTIEELKRSEAVFEVFTSASTEADDLNNDGDLGLNPEQHSVLKALSDPRYTLRTVTGVFKSARAAQEGAMRSKDRTNEVLQELLDFGLARTAKGKSNTVVWGLTPSGRAQVQPD
ncbi:hypothetical protein EBB79_00335 [Parasedimentitalea marina]|uniref:Uncharacterized protein n=2 Tax=Parasedimentitalea marina TaxID=2483033 RepID=A0A3T0MXK2_9RHOB|nr:hypothetical protein EBB79_00335 [Parasedimentitalea marina]